MKDVIANKMQELKEKYPCVTYEGNTYYPIEDALFDIYCNEEPYYWARAIKESDHHPDEWDCVHLYVIIWNLKDKYYNDWKHRWEESEYDDYDVDESDMCDWDSPYDVVDNDDYESVDDILKIQI